MRWGNAGHEKKGEKGKTKVGPNFPPKNGRAGRGCITNPSAKLTGKKQ